MRVHNPANHDDPRRVVPVHDDDLAPDNDGAVIGTPDDDMGGNRAANDAEIRRHVLCLGGGGQEPSEKCNEQRLFHGDLFGCLWDGRRD
jgi:hypothetical protein